MARVLITGCSSGIGRATALLLTERGHEVVATARRPETLADLPVTARLRLDITDQASVDAMKTWNIHTVRIPINEQCWLGTYGTPSGATYQQAVKDYVTLLVANGINPIIDLHWTYGSYSGGGNGNCTDVNATCQKPMPDAQYAPQLWTSVATAFKGNNAVLFDLFNEPWPDNADGYASAANEWKCWRDGGTCGGITYQVAGMQSLVNAVRGTGATNVILLGGLAWSNDLTQWLTYKPTDSAGNLVAAWHVYNFNSCSNTSCWDSQIAPVAAQVPVVAGEIGQNSCAHDFIDQVMAWADAHNVGYLAWTWNPWGCGSGNVLIQDYTGTATHSITILAGQTTGTITVAPTADTSFEPDETVVVTLTGGSSGAGAVLVSATQGSATGTIAPPPRATFPAGQ